jgi:hypothetical protein
MSFGFPNMNRMFENMVSTLPQYFAMISL